MNSLKKLVFAFACFMVVSLTASAALPPGYTLVEYIQGDKNVYLKTDFTPDPATDKIVTEVMLTDASYNQVLFSASDETNEITEPKWAIQLRADGIRLDYNNNGTAEQLTMLKASVNKRITYTVASSNLTWEGGSPITSKEPAPTGPLTGPVQILGMKYKNNLSFCGTIRLYSFKVYRNGELIHDYVPVKDDQSNATLWDACGSSTITKVGNGTLSAGPTYVFEVEDIPVQRYRSGRACTPKPVVKWRESGLTLTEGQDYELSWTNNAVVGKGTVTVTGRGDYASATPQPVAFRVVPKLPSGYRAVDFVHSTGAQFVDTGFKPNEKTRADIRFLLYNQQDTKLYSSPFGARHGNEMQFFVSASAGEDYFFSRFGTASTDLGTYGHSQLLGKPSNWGAHSFSLNRNVFSLDKWNYTLTTPDFQCDCSAYVFATQNSANTPTVSHQSIMDLYSLQIWGDGVLVRDFVPCVKVEGETETVGLYDLAPNATKRFYENGATGAPLVAGPATPLPKDNGLVLILR